MAKVKVSIVHDEGGHIVAIARPSDYARTIVLSGDGQSVFETEVEEDSIIELASGNHRVDIRQNAIV